MKTLTTLLLLLALSTSGCLIVRLEAETILTMQPTDAASTQSVTVGFREAEWAPTKSGPIAIACGWHPREHETYCFFMSEPYPVMNPRWLVLRPTQGATSHTLELWFGYNLCRTGRPWTAPVFTCTLNVDDAIAGRTFRLRMKDQQLRNANGEKIAVSGSIVAHRTSIDSIEQGIRDRDQKIQDRQMRLNTRNREWEMLNNRIRQTPEGAGDP